MQSPCFFQYHYRVAVNPSEIRYFAALGLIQVATPWRLPLGSDLGRNDLIDFIISITSVRLPSSR